MIVYDLACGDGHRFEGWFGSSGEFAAQQSSGLIMCPHCGSLDVVKAPMAPAVSAKGNQRSEARPANTPTTMTNREVPPEVRQAMLALAKAQAKALSESRWVGDGFAEESRAMHYGEKAVEAIHGKATLKEARGLLEEGIQVAPLPFPVAEPDELN